MSLNTVIKAREEHAKYLANVIRRDIARLQIDGVCHPDLIEHIMLCSIRCAVRNARKLQEYYSKVRN